MDQPHQPAQFPALPDEYDPPRVERVVTADELARDVQYAGGVSVDTQP